MGKKSENRQTLQVEWEPNAKESWHYELEKEPVNDDKWTCIVTAAIEGKAEDEDSIQIFNKCVASNNKNVIKTITMTDVINIIKNSGGGHKKKSAKSKNDKGSKIDNKSSKKVSRKKDKKEEKKCLNIEPPPPIKSPIVDLVARYSTFAESQCILPANLMAALIKYLILNLKNENIFWKKVDMARKKKERQRKVKMNLIKNMKPYEYESKGETKENLQFRLESGDLGSDERYAGPDLYIVLTGFYNPFYFTELVQMNVPFVAILKILDVKEIPGTSKKLTSSNSKKEILISNFWETLTQNCIYLQTTVKFKDFVMIQFQFNTEKVSEYENDMNLVYDFVFDEWSRMLYSVYFTYRQHKAFLRETLVQGMMVSAETLDLSRCKIYNELCDELVTGEPNAVYLILYALVEQVSAGVPPTKVFYMESERNFGEISSNNFESGFNPEDVNTNSKEKNYVIVPPCLECRNKKFKRENICEKNLNLVNTSSEGKEENVKTNQSVSVHESKNHVIESDPSERSSKSKNLSCGEISLTNSCSMKNGKESKPNENGKQLSWKIPQLYFYGDNVSLVTYHCNTNLISSEIIVNRFLKNTEIPRLWLKYPELSPEKKAFYNYHFSSLLQISNDRRDLLSTKIFFVHSMKLIEIMRSYLYRGEEQNKSEMFGAVIREKSKNLSKVKFDEPDQEFTKRYNERNFSEFFFKPFFSKAQNKSVGKAMIKIGETEKTKSYLFRHDSSLLRKVTSEFNMFLMNPKTSGFCFPYCIKNLEIIPKDSSTTILNTDMDLNTLHSLLDCHDISNLSEPHIMNAEDKNSEIIKKFNFFEVLDSHRMVQRLMEAQEDFNTTQCAYFAPTDTMILVMQNDCDYRGLFYSFGFGALPTPICLRDFHSYVCPEITEWLRKEKRKYAIFVAEVKERIDDLEKVSDMEYLLKLKKDFCKMSSEEKETFMNINFETFLDTSEIDAEIREEDLESLPTKPKPNYPYKISFITTNLLDVRVETQTKVHEFYSKDGTVVSVVEDSWIYEPIKLLSLGIKKSKLKFTYHQWLGLPKTDNNFSLKTLSGIIFSFHKEGKDIFAYQSDGDSLVNDHYQLKISWATGLIIEKMYENKVTYIKQSYIEVYKKRNKVSEEKSRCFLKSGKIIIFKNDGEVNILFASGTKFIFKEIVESYYYFNEENFSQTPAVHIPQYKIITTKGEIWEKTSVGPCKNKMKLYGTLKMYAGVDTQNHETYYRREDGMQWMLWPNGKLVTTFPDGTKITSIPVFDEYDVILNWTEEEILNLKKAEEYREYAGSEIRGKTILKKSSLNATNASKLSFPFDGFVSVSLSYLMEHPKYSSVFYEKNDNFKLSMPEQISVEIKPSGDYVIRQETTSLIVQSDNVEFSTNCSSCNDKSSATVFFDSEEVLCQFVDFFSKSFFVYRNGKTIYEEPGYDREPKASYQSCRIKSAEKTFLMKMNCDHKSFFDNQRCFALERNLSGIEFIHKEALAQHCYNLPLDTHFQLDEFTENTTIPTHTMSCPYFKVGFENWTMNYQDKEDSLPTKLKKCDLKEVGAKDFNKKPFKYPFPKNYNLMCTSDPIKNIDEKPEMPKVIITRVVKVLSENPEKVIDELQNYVSAYQNQAHNILKYYTNFKKTDNENQDARNTNVKLKKVALTGIRKTNLHSLKATETPSTEVNIHRSGHKTNLMNEINGKILTDADLVFQCKHISKPLPRFSYFNTIHEDVNQDNNFLS